MGTTRVIVILFLACIDQPVVRSVTCTWSGAIESEGACFLYDSYGRSYTKAKIACKARGGVLAKLKSQTQLMGTSIIPEDEFVWIGANDIENEGTWVWEEDGSVATELNQLWAIRKPEYEKIGNCASIIHFEIVDFCCSSFFSSLCMERVVHTTQGPVTSLFTQNGTATTNTAASKIDTSATTNAAPSTIDTSATTNAATSTIDISATTNAAASTVDTRATTNIEASKTGTSKFTNTAASKTDTGATAVATSVPLTSTTKITTSKKNDANGIHYNVLFIFYMCAFTYLAI